MRRSRMKCPSLFHFYRAYYGGHSQGKVHFARAIAATGKLVTTVFQEKSWKQYEQYINYQYALPLTKGFLRRFYELGEQYYGRDFFEKLEWLDNRVMIPEELVGKREVYIPFSYCFEAEKKNLIFLEYGRLDTVEKWLPIFKTLAESFQMEKTMTSFETVTYWDLMKGTTMELSYYDSFLAPKERIVQTARRLVEETNVKKGINLH